MKPDDLFSKSAGKVNVAKDERVKLLKDKFRHIKKKRIFTSLNTKTDFLKF